jgi:hypothetical protein
VAETTWSDYGPCGTCGSVAGWPCHRGKRQLKNPHPGRPKTGQEPYAAPAAEAEDFRDPATRPGMTIMADAERAPLATEARASGCTCPEPAHCPECCHDPSCPEGEDPRVWCDCRDDETCKGPCRQRAHDPRQHRDPVGLEWPEGPSTYHPPAAGWQVANGDTDTGAYGVADPAGDPLAPWGWAEIALRGRDPEDVIAGNDPRDAKLIDYLAAQAMPPAEAEPAAYHPVLLAWPGGTGARFNTATPTTTEETTVAMDPAAEAVDWTARLDNAEREPKNPAGKRNVDAEVPRDVDRDQYDRPKLVRAELQPDGTWLVPFFPPGPEPHAGTPIIELEGFTRASTLGNALEDATGLNTWRGGMVVFGMSRRKDLVLAAQAVPGTEDKKLHRRPLYDIARQALEAAEASSAATVGTALHALTEQADAGTLAVDIGEYQPVLDIYLERMAGWKVVRSETFVVSDYFHSAGTFDRLITPLEPMALVDQHTGEIITVIMPGDLVVVDLKTSTTADYFGAKFFAQLAVYVTGQLYDRDPESPTYGARTPLGQRTDFALILHIPQGGDADGEPVADWHWLDMRVGMALAQLACVNLETRKKRFTRTHMRPVLAQTLTDDQAAADIRTGGASGRRVLGGLTRVPAQLPARDPLGDRHLRPVAGAIAAAESFPDIEADRVDAELIEDHRMPEERRASHAALVGFNLGTDDRAPAEECSTCGLSDGKHDEECSAKEATVPGPDETAPLPAGWESKEEQALAAEATTEVPKGLGAQLQDAAARHKVEEALIRKIRAAKSVRGPDGLKDLYQRASAAGYWTDRVIAAASARRQELEAAG